MGARALGLWAPFYYLLIIKFYVLLCRGPFRTTIDRRVPSRPQSVTGSPLSIIFFWLLTGVWSGWANFLLLILIQYASARGALISRVQLNFIRCVLCFFSLCRELTSTLAAWVVLFATASFWCYCRQRKIGWSLRRQIQLWPPVKVAWLRILLSCVFFSNEAWFEMFVPRAPRARQNFLVS